MDETGQAKRRKRWLHAVTGLYALVIVGLVALADQKGTRTLLAFMRDIPYGDKLGHFTLMGLLSLLVNLSLAGRTVRLGRWNLLVGSLIVFTLVTLEELSQHFIPARTFDLVDLTCDALGIWLFGRLALRLAPARAQAGGR